MAAGEPGLPLHRRGRDGQSSRLVSALRFRGVPAVTVFDAGLTEKSDEDQLAFATRLDCALYTFNVPDFHRIHQHWIATGRGHAGIILAPQQRFSVGEQLKRLLRLRASITAEEMRNRAEFLVNWG
jgi:hypothetical protein